MANQTNVKKLWSANTGVANTFSWSGGFEVFKSTEVEVYLDGPQLTYTATTINESATPREYSVDIANKTVHIGGADLTTGDLVIKANTDVTSARATYQGGSSVASADLNQNQDQILRKISEVQIADETSFSASATPPENPNHGDIWFDSVSGRTYIYYVDIDSGQWVEGSPAFDSQHVTITGDINLPDNSKVNLGTGTDLQIYHNGVNSLISDQGAGGINIQGSHINLLSPLGDKSLINAEDGAAVALYHNGTNRLETTASGVTISTDLVVDNLKAKKITLDMGGELTIASGIITATHSFHSVDTESDAGSDDLVTINGGTAGMLLTLRAADNARTVVVKDSTGNIRCGGDRTLDHSQDSITLLYLDDTNGWVETTFANNTA